MSDDTTGLDTDRADSLDRFYDPSGITALGETPATAYTQINHNVIIQCKSVRRRIAGLKVAFAKPKPGERRGMCPSCGKMATYKFSEEHRLWWRPSWRPKPHLSPTRARTRSRSWS